MERWCRTLSLRLREGGLVRPAFQPLFPSAGRLNHQHMENLVASRRVHLAGLEVYYCLYR